MGQVIQIVGSLMVLAAFAAAQRGLLDPRSVVYLVLNLVGSAYLALGHPVEVENDAVPPLSVALPIDATPSKNCTFPVAAGADTVAVNVTIWPEIDGFAEDAIVVVVGVSDGPPHDGNWKEMMRVFQLADAVAAWYSCVYQKVQSSLGSILIAE